MKKPEHKINIHRFAYAGLSTIIGNERQYLSLRFIGQLKQTFTYLLCRQLQAIYKQLTVIPLLLPTR